MKQKDKDPTKLTPRQFLLISSPMEKKICYTALEDFKATPTGAVSPLIDSGLMSPQGIAVDKVGGFLYIADMDARKVFRYSLVVKEGKLMTTGVQMTVVSGKVPRWVAVDMHQNLYYSDPENGLVGKVDADTIDQIAAGEITAEDLVTRQEKEEEALANAEAQANLAQMKMPPTAPPEPKPEMMMLYQKGANPHVARPSGIATNSVNVFWGNEASGTTAGAIVSGEVDPQAPAVALSGGESGQSSQAFSSTVLAVNTNKVFGVTITHNAVVYSDAARSVYGVPMTGGPVATFTDQLEAPRGLAWDGDGTVYVADQAGSVVYSFPSGKLAATQTSRVVTLHDAFGVALLSELDPGFTEKSQGVTAGLFLSFALVLAGFLGDIV
jgi:DNA-binding beta-propeller fold protein YncE